MNKSPVLSALALASTLLFAGASVASAQTVYTSPSGTSYSVPVGYQAYNYGDYYNPVTGLYYDPRTGQTSLTAPTGPGQLSAPSYSVPSGYQAYNYGTYYNATTGTYYDPRTGQMSSTAPTGSTSVPSGYNASLYGTYYNPTTGTYLDPATGFTSTSAPTGPVYNTQTTYSVNGVTYPVPSGYVSSSYGTFYNSSTGTYYDPVTGFTSTSAPTGPVFGTTTVTPTLPNTGAGGDAPMNFLVLALAAAVALGGTVYLRARQGSLR